MEFNICAFTTLSLHRSRMGWGLRGLSFEISQPPPVISPYQAAVFCVIIRIVLGQAQRRQVNHHAIRLDDGCACKREDLNETIKTHYLAASMLSMHVQAHTIAVVGDSCTGSAGGHGEAVAGVNGVPHQNGSGPARARLLVG